MHNFTILYEDAEVAHAEAERFEDAREQALFDLFNSIYAEVANDCTFSATHPTHVIHKVTGPLFL
ncbi:hypothetical protein BG58_11150 [Caballeronia jiangsuensis]|nr:hypothetical protein BG58_11150 [Caballeronia jiangsuensis]